MANLYPSYEDVQKVREVLGKLAHEHWLHHDLWSFNWWLNLFLAIGPWFIWWKWVDKKRVFEILSYGLLAGILATVLDVIGADLILWGYPDKLFSMVPPLFPADLTVIPVTFMLIYQHFPTWKSFIWANVIMASLFSFVFEPILVWMNIYRLHHWEYIYSFPIYIAMAVLLKWLIQKIMESQLAVKQ